MHGNSWLGPAVVLCQRGQSVWIHTNGDIRKVVACKVKPYKFIDRESEEYKRQIDHDTKGGKKISRRVMLEDGLKNVEDLADPEEEERKDAMKPDDVMANVVGTNYLKIVTICLFPITQLQIGLS